MQARATKLVSHRDSPALNLAENVESFLDVVRSEDH